MYGGAKSGCNLPTVFDSDCDNGVNAGKGVQHTSPTSRSVNINLQSQSFCRQSVRVSLSDVACTSEGI